MGQSAERNMYGGHDAEIYERIGCALLSILPVDAERIRAKGKVGEDWAEVGFEFEDKSGKLGTFSFKNHPARAAGDISEALIDLRKLMSGGGAEAWNQCEFTVARDGKFGIKFGYEAQAKPG
jgi:hypothetical protein